MKKFLTAMMVLTSIAIIGACGQTSTENTTGKTENASSEVSDQSSESSEASSKKEVSSSEDIPDKDSLIPTAEEYDSDGNLILPQLEEPKAGDPIAVMSTNMGDIKIRLFPEYAPKAVANFVTHAKEGYYDGLIFHRVINNFMIQGGDPNGIGTGGESIWGEPFEDEFTYSLRNFRGALSMANSGANTNGSQFFIVQNPSLDPSLAQVYKNGLNQQDEEIENGDGTTFRLGDVYPTDLLNEYINNGGTPHLDFVHTVFGQVYEGMDIVDKIAAVETDESDKPKEDVIIESITIGEY